MSVKSFPIVLVTLLAAVLFLVCAGQVRADTAAAGDYAVIIKSFAFMPATLEIPVGARVTWNNQDTTVHSVISSDKKFTPSPGLDTGDQYSYLFDKPGTYTYYCSLHPFMTGKIIVKEK